MKRVAWRWVIVTLAAAVVALGAGPAFAAPPSLTFEAQAVVASGVAVGGSVAVFGVSRGFNGFTGYTLRHDQVLTDADGDGAVRLELELPVSVRSVFAAVDLGTGEVGLGSPPGWDLAASLLPPEAIGAVRQNTRSTSS